MWLKLGTGWFATAIRLTGLGLIVWSVFAASPEPGVGFRGVVVAVLLAGATASWLAWSATALQAGAPLRRHGLPLYVMAGAGGLLCEASPHGAASAFVFVAVVAAGIRVGLVRALPVVAVGTLGLVVSVLVYGHGGLGTLAYVLGFAAAALGGSNARQSSLRAEEAEMLLAQTQRAHEEELRSARLEESARIAREIHDVLAHTLAGLMIQLESTATLIERGSDGAAVLGRVEHAGRLAREGLVEARRAVGVLRGGREKSVSDALGALVDDHRTLSDAPAEVTVDGDRVRLEGASGEAVLRVVQEALTNVRKHAARAAVSVTVDAGVDSRDEIVAVVEDDGCSGQAPTRPAGSAESVEPGQASRSAAVLATSGGGYGLRGMRERAQLLGGTLAAGPTEDGWRVELRLPPAEPEVAAAPADDVKLGR